MKNNTIKFIKIAAVTASLAGIVTAMGFGCGMGWQPGNHANSDNNGFSSFNPPGDSGDNTDLTIVSGTKTIAVTNFTSVLDNMTNMTGVAPSANTNTVFSSKLGSFSETGSALSVNAPMLMGYVAVGAEVCTDLINQEQPLAAAQRRFFGALNLTANNTNSTAVNDAAIADMTRRFARQFWQRNETPEELAMVTAGAKEALAAVAANTAGLSRRVAMYTCTAIIASTSGYEL